MNERPILFSAPMVRAILDGRKTQTRRALTAKAIAYIDEHQGFREPSNSQVCPYGQPGDRLWVKETWRTDVILDAYAPRELAEMQPIKFEADDESTAIVAFGWGKVRQSIFMRRWMSRITLEIVSVCVERLNLISDEDALAEGVGPADPNWVGTVYDGKWRAAYRSLWEDINGEGSWAANPWVWVLEFRRVSP